ncbi:hydrolase [Syntrophotalea acetylenivorans]|uniref:Hydrolase n=1 Tax=Syntrophotalea acetylenivorans TaxID=1842532 RepID=A0A1L3GP07_9BACT|nr:NlpC/P60 family protein [Syntrophotalea acetylenivorans]APG27654.1 hydrolase [Syntrophotalea acetylenivorans]
MGDPIGQLLENRQPEFSPTQAPSSLSRMGYSVQVGAFANLDNAVRFERLLDQRGIDAFYFRHQSGLFKVRFGNHADYKSARGQAEQLSSQGLIDNFFIVIPESYSVSRTPKNNQDKLRDELVKTARRFIGIPYRWGGTDQAKGFDCSGLTMVCYRLNGLNLPRVSRSQFKAGRWVAKNKLVRGDLVFFATNGGNRVSHVGMYIGNGRFIHAPRTGKKVRIEKLSNPFFTKTYMGGRCYL